MFDFLTRSEIIQHVIHKLQELANQIADGHLFLFAKIDQLAFQPVTHGAPFVFLNQRATVKPKAKILVDERIQFCDDCLKQRGDGDRVVNASGDIADAKFQRRKIWMRPDVPPYLFPVIDTAGLNQQIHITLKPGIRIKMIRNVGTRELLEDL